MIRTALAFLMILAVATPARADVRLWAFDPADRVTRALTRGLTFQVQRGLFGAVRVEKLYATTSRGSAEVRRGGPDGTIRVLPQGARERAVYEVVSEGEGRALGRALCPSADAVWLVMGRVRQGRPLTMHAVGRWSDGTFRHCVALSYLYRGEWAAGPESAGPTE